jgi:hypothetical protein
MIESLKQLRRKRTDTSDQLSGSLVERSSNLDDWHGKPPRLIYQHISQESIDSTTQPWSLGRMNAIGPLDRDVNNQVQRRQRLRCCANQLGTRRAPAQCGHVREVVGGRAIEDDTLGVSRSSSASVIQ